MKSKKLYYILLLVLVVIMLVLAFGKFDFNFSEQLINRESIWAEFFNMFGELPFTAGMLISTAILYGSHERKKAKTIILSIISYPLMLLFSFAVVIMPFNYFYEFDGGIPNSAYIPAIILAILLFAALVYFLVKKDVSFFRKYRKSALVLLLLVISELVLVNVLKMVWARPRMRSIEGFEQFKYWWQVNGFKNLEEFKSFPSGHTANAFAMIAGVSFIASEDGKKKWMLFAFTWGSLTALSRVVLGAHFLSDVIFGGIVTVVLYRIINKLIIERNYHE